MINNPPDLYFTTVISTYTYGNAAAMLRLASLTTDGLGEVYYTYDAYGKLTKIARGTTEYNLTYDTWNRPLQTKVGASALSTNAYDAHKRLSTVTYANGFSVRYVYDDLDRVRKIYHTENNTESLTYEMLYNGDGELYEVRNFRTQRASTFAYDHAGRCVQSAEYTFTYSLQNGEAVIDSYDAIISSYAYRYDNCSNLTKLTCSVAGSTWDTVYTYDNDNRPKTTTLSSGKVLTNTYDVLGRISKRAIGLSTAYETNLTYVAGYEPNETTSLVATYQNGSDAAYSYTYDDNGNITQITQGNTSITYTYDEANRLTRENNQVTNKTVTYEYDAWGNILNKKTYAYTTGTLGTPTQTIPYGYTNTAWGDQLTSYNGHTLTYDSMGNPTHYFGCYEYEFTWRGKQLVGAKYPNATNPTWTYSFEYNEDGLRQRKQVTTNGITVNTDYYYNGSVLIGMQRANDVFRFSYDASGNVVSVNYNGTEYYYLRNAQGDIVKLIDGSGGTVVTYTYDTWGKKVSITGTLASTLGQFQPFRYRGYVYDEETGLYYLQSRYYDPVTGRFISADILLSTGQGVLGHNCYAYCNDNPVNSVDNGGNDPFWILNLFDYAAIHKMVQIQCAIDNGWAMEVYVSGPEGNGYLDLLDCANKEYYEVKSKKAAKRESTFKQMAKYSCSKVEDTFGNRGKIDKDFIGMKVTPGTASVEGYFQYGIYDIDYYSVQDGLIAYDISLNTERALELGISVATVALLAAVLGAVTSVVLAPAAA